MAKTTSTNKIRSTESLLSRNDLTSLNSLNAHISSQLLEAMTVIDADNFQKLTAIQNVVSNKEIYIDQQIDEMVNNYNRELINYNEAEADFSYYGWSRATTGLTGHNLTNFRSIARRYDQSLTSMNRIATIVPVPSSSLDISSLPTITSGSLLGIIQAKSTIAHKKTVWNEIIKESNVFEKTTTPIEISNNTSIAQQLFEFDKMPSSQVSYGFFNQDAAVLGTGNITISGVPTNCYQLIVEESGVRKTGYVPVSQLFIDPDFGDVRVGSLTTPSVLRLYDLSGADITPDTDFTVQINVGATYEAHKNHTGNPDWTGLHLRATRPLVIKRGTSISAIDRNDILTNPPFTTELNARMRITQRKHTGVVPALNSPESNIAKTLTTYLEKYPQYANLTDEQKNTLKGLLVSLKQATTGGGPVDLFGGKDMSDAITQTQGFNIDPSSLSMSDHSVLFSSYLQSKDSQPQPTPEDSKNETHYRNWLSRNLALLTENYIQHLLDGYMNHPLIAQAFNDTTTRFLGQIETDALDHEDNKQKYETHILTHVQSGARHLRSCKPAKSTSKRNHGNNTWTRLMTGHGAKVIDHPVQQDGKKIDYTTEVKFSTTPAITASIQIDGGETLVYHGMTPGDLLAKLLTGGGGRIDGQFTRMQLAFGTMKAIIKSCIQTGMLMSVPINGTAGDELRLTLDASDNLKVERYNFDISSDSYILDTTAGNSFDEKNADHKMLMTDDFLVQMNEYTNTILDRQYAKFSDTTDDASSNIKNFGRWMTLDRERMSYKANPRWMRGLLTKWINRKQPGIEGFSFPVDVGGKTVTVSYDPNGTISIEGAGKKRTGKNLAKLLNPQSLNRLGGVFNKTKNFTDGFEIPVMQGLYEGLSQQLMKNERINTYTYLVRDTGSNHMYTMYTDHDGAPQIGIIENVTKNSGTLTRSENMLLLDYQKWGRTKGIPPQGIRQLNEKDQKAILGRPDIMDGFIQNMMKAREEILNVSVGKGRSFSLNANSMARVGTVGAALAAIGGINLASGGLLSSGAYNGGLATTKSLTGTGVKTLGNAMGQAASGIADVFASGAQAVGAGVKGLYTGIGS